MYPFLKFIQFIPAMPVTSQQLLQWKKEGRPIIALTAWDFTLSRLLDEAGVDLILVGDSLAMVALGYDSTLPLTLDEVIHHGKAVQRSVRRGLVICDLPFGSYQESVQQAVQSACRVIKETGVQGVKLEGGYPAMIDTVQRLVQIGIPVLGHVGLTPQSVHLLGYRQQGRSPESRLRILEEAIALEQAGAFAVVLEHIPSDLGLEITQTLTIPTIGIGAGCHCDGQILVTADLLGLSVKKPPFAKVYADLSQVVTHAVQQYCQDVAQKNW